MLASLRDIHTFFIERRRCEREDASFRATRASPASGSASSDRGGLPRGLRVLARGRERGAEDKLRFDWRDQDRGADDGRLGCPGPAQQPGGLIVEAVGVGGLFLPTGTPLARVIERGSAPNLLKASATRSCPTFP